MVHTLLYFLQALSRIGIIAAIIPKSSQYVPTVLESLKELYKSIICDDSINKITLKQEPAVRSFLQKICKQYPERKLMILDHGGYFAPGLDILRKFSERIAGIVEHTSNGHLKYKESLKHITLAIPVYSIARSRLKTYEDEYVAISTIDAMSANVFAGAGISQSLSRLKIGIIGYGHMGEAIADQLSTRLRGKGNLLICDAADDRFGEAQRSGYKCSKEISLLLRECNVIIAAASTQIVGSTWSTSHVTNQNSCVK